ncbi:MAG: MFS transporter, partial [Nitrospiraceae bacterium]
VADRLGGLVVLRGLFPILTLLAGALAFMPGLVWTGLLLVAALACMGFGNGVVFQVVSERLAKQIGLASGVIGAAGGFGGVLVPLSFGLLKEHTGGFGMGFVVFAGASLVALGTVIVALRRSRHGAMPA